MDPATLVRRATTLFLATAPLLASIAMAQGAPPTPSGTRNISPLIGYGILVVLGGAVVAISLYPSKRSHQDV